MNETIKLIYGDYKINIKTINNKWWLDFYYDKKRIRKSTSLLANEENLNNIKKNIIPELFSALTGKKEIEYFKKELTFDEFSTKFFNVYKETVRTHVYESRYRHYELKIKPYFGNKLISSITPLELEEWQSKMIKNYKQNSVKKYRSVFFSIFDKALKNDLIKYNPLSRIKSPLEVKKRFKLLKDDVDETIKPFNIDEIKEILDKATGNLYYVIFLILHTGIRPGELISLSWNDVDFDKKRIAVDKTTVKGKIGNVKTQSSVRYIDILPQLEVKLKEMKKNSLPHTRLFQSHLKKDFYSHDILNKRFKLLLKDINIKERSIYNLRHTFASHMISNIENGVDILWVSKTLGHKDVSITLKVYAKYIKESDDLRFKKLKQMGSILDIL